MKVSKKTGITLFVTAAVIMAVLIVFHKNPGPAADPGQELAKKIISCVVIAAACFDVMSVSILHISTFLSSRSLLDLIDPIKLILFIVAFVAIRKFKKHPVLYIAVSAVIGIILAL